MSVQRSPTGSDTISSRSGSYPDLPSKIIAQDTSEMSQITYRNKRKLNETEEIKAELTDMKKQMTSMQNQMSEIMTYLSTMNNTQTENFKKLNQDVLTIKQQINDIKITTDNLTEEQSKLKQDISSLKESKNITEKKLYQIESKLQHEDAGSSSAVNVREEIVTELNERGQRSKNIIISGVLEPNANSQSERRAEDKTAVLKIINNIVGHTDTPEPERIYRLGKYKSDKCRHLKVCFSSPDIVKSILKNRKNQKEEKIKVFSDQTPQQQEYMAMLKQRLENRIASGEDNLCIKYIRGVPKITKQTPKNSSQEIH